MGAGSLGENQSPSPPDETILLRKMRGAGSKRLPRGEEKALEIFGLGDVQRNGMIGGLRHSGDQVGGAFRIRHPRRSRSEELVGRNVVRATERREETIAAQ